MHECSSSHFSCMNFNDEVFKHEYSTCNGMNAQRRADVLSSSQGHSILLYQMPHFMQVQLQLPCPRNRNLLIQEMNEFASERRVNFS